MRIAKVPLYGVGRYGRSHVNAAFEYYNPKTGEFESPYVIVERLQYKGVEYRQIPEFEKYYISKKGRILSLNGAGARLLTTQYGNTNRGIATGDPIARIRSNDGKNYTRSVYKLVREIW